MEKRTAKRTDHQPALVDGRHTSANSICAPATLRCQPNDHGPCQSTLQLHQHTDLHNTLPSHLLLLRSSNSTDTSAANHSCSLLLPLCFGSILRGGCLVRSITVCQPPILLCSTAFSLVWGRALSKCFLAFNNLKVPLPILFLQIGAAMGR